MGFIKLVCSTWTNKFKRVWAERITVEYMNPAGARCVRSGPPQSVVGDNRLLFTWFKEYGRGRISVRCDNGVVVTGLTAQFRNIFDGAGTGQNIAILVNSKITILVEDWDVISQDRSVMAFAAGQERPVIQEPDRFFHGGPGDDDRVFRSVEFQVHALIDHEYALALLGVDHKTEIVRLVFVYNEGSGAGKFDASAVVEAIYQDVADVVFTDQVHRETIAHEVDIQDICGAVFQGQCIRRLVVGRAGNFTQRVTEVFRGPGFADHEVAITVFTIDDHANVLFRS